MSDYILRILVEEGTQGFSNYYLVALDVARDAKFCLGMVYIPTRKIVLPPSEVLSNARQFSAQW